MEGALLTVYLVSYATVWTWQIVGFPFTKLLFYVDFVFPTYVMGVAALLNEKLAVLSRKSCAVLSGVVLVAGGSLLFLANWLARFAGVSASYIQAHPGLGILWSKQAFWLTGIGIIGGVAFALLRSRPRGALVAFSTAFLLVCGLQLALQNQQGWFGGWRGYTNKQGFNVIVAGDAWANQLRPDRQLLVWYDSHETKQDVLAGLSSLYLWGWTLVNNDLPKLPPSSIDRVGSGSDILVISTGPVANAKARSALNQAGFAITGDRETRVSDGPLALYLGLLNVFPKASRMEDLIGKEGLKEVDGALPLADVVAGGGTVSVEPDNNLHIVTLPAQWAYAAAQPLPFDSGDSGEVWVRVSAKVLHGTAGFGVLTRDESKFAVRTSVAPSSSFHDVVLMLAHPEDSSKLIIENDTPGGQNAEVLIAKISLFARARSRFFERLESRVLREVAGFLRAADISPTSTATLIEKGDAVDIVTPAGQWSYAAFLPLKLSPVQKSGKVWIRISARVVHGTAGFGILSSGGKHFYNRASLERSSANRDLTLEVGHPEDSEKLIVENDSPSGEKAEVIVTRVTLLARKDSNVWRQLNKTDEVQGAVRAAVR